MLSILPNVGLPSSSFFILRTGIAMNSMNSDKSICNVLAMTPPIPTDIASCDLTNCLTCLIKVIYKLSEGFLIDPVKCSTLVFGESFCFDNLLKSCDENLDNV